MSDDYQRIELITGTARRRHWTTDQKLRIIDESLAPGESVSSVARRHGVAPNLLYRWRRLMAEGGAMAVGSDESVVGSSEVRRLEERVRELERLLGRKTLEVEILKEALAKAQTKNRTCGSRRCRRTLPNEAGGRGAQGGAIPSP
jgi:transposase